MVLLVKIVNSSKREWVTSSCSCKIQLEFNYIQAAPLNSNEWGMCVAGNGINGGNMTWLLLNYRIMGCEMETLSSKQPSKVNRTSTANLYSDEDTRFNGLRRQ